MEIQTRRDEVAPFPTTPHLTSKVTGSSAAGVLFGISPGAGAAGSASFTAASAAGAGAASPFFLSPSSVFEGDAEPFHLAAQERTGLADACGVSKGWAAKPLIAKRIAIVLRG